MERTAQTAASPELLGALVTALEAVDEGVHAVDADGVTIFYNRAAALLDNLDPSEVVGKPLLAVFPSLTPETSTLLAVLRTGKAISAREQTFTNYKGDQITTLNTTLPLYRAGKLVGAVEISRNLTAMRELAHKVVDLQVRLYGRSSPPGAPEGEPELPDALPAAGSSQPLGPASAPARESAPQPAASPGLLDPAGRPSSDADAGRNEALGGQSRVHAAVSTTTPPDRPLSVTGVGKSVTGVEKGTAPEPALFTLEDIIGTSPAILELKHKVARIARLPSPILVYGETGAGKEILVQAIHSAGPRRNGPFVAQNCAALPEGLLESILFGTTRGSFTGAQDRPGLFEVADGGTLFLDEIDSMPPNLQAKLLRAVTESGARRVGDLKLRRFNIRLAAAISSHPSRAVESGALRADLYYRLSVILLAVPPLRERKEDIPALVEHFVACFNRQFGTGVRRVTPEVMEILVNHDWPGNVRELRNTIESAMALAEGDAITLDHIRPDLVAALPLRRAETPPPPAALSAPPPEPPALRAAETPAPAAAGPVTTDAGKLAAPLRVTVKDTERQLIAAALAECQGNLTRAARKLGIPRQTLQYRIKVLRKAGLI